MSQAGILDAYVDKAPHPQNVLDLFAGEWTSRFPAESGLISKPGTAPLFSDRRLQWAGEILGGFDGQDILELGPLEGAHTWLLSQAGARSITAVEANSRAFLKCLCVKEVLGLDRAKFLLGDFQQYLKQTDRRFDLVIASGVLYHMKDPIQLLARIASVADRVMLWTHYYDADLIAANEALDGKFGRLKKYSHDGFKYRGAAQAYKKALDWQGFCGGMHKDSLWLTLDSLHAALKYVGYTEISEGFKHPAHPNGPALAICAWR